MSLARADRRFLGAVGIALLATALFAAWIGLHIGGDETSLWVDDLATPAAALLACALCLRARSGQEGRLRLFWSLLACATAFWTLAEVICGFYALILAEEVPVPSWADVGYLAAIPLAVAALIVHPAMQGSTSRKTRWVFDGLVVATALLFLSWTVVLGPLWRSADLGTWTGVVTLAYPFGDVVIVFFIVLAIRGMTGSDRHALWCLLAGLLAMALSDSTFTYMTDVANYSGGNLIDTGWVAAYLGIALAAYSSGQEAQLPEPALARAPSLASLISPLLPVLLALTVAAVEIRLGHHLDRAAWVMAFSLIGLVLIRQTMLVMELLAPGRGSRGELLRRLTHAALAGAAGDEPPSPDYRASRP